MAYVYEGVNRRPFSAVCKNKYGRKVIRTQASEITKENLLEELDKALTVHIQNVSEIQYLNKYYSGDQPILYRKKVNRPEVNNKVVVNLAYELVERKTAEICSEPIQYVLRGSDEKKTEEIAKLNKMFLAESKQECDIELCRWRSIAGTSYRFIGNDEADEDEPDFFLSCEDPTLTFVVYDEYNREKFSCQIREDEKGSTVYNIYTNKSFFFVDAKRNITERVNGNKRIPVIEYPNNSRRLSDIEITIGITDAINVLQSDRINGIEQFVSSWIKFVNCEVDEKSFLAMRQQGALVVKSNNGAENKADVDVLSNELNQTEGQVVFADLFERFLDIQGLSNRGQNTGGDTQGAVQLRNGHIDSSMRTAINEPILKKSENKMLKVILNRLRINQRFTLVVSDIDIHINHNKQSNMLVKAETLKMILDAGVAPKHAIKQVDLFSDPEQVTKDSKDRMDILYPTEQISDISSEVDAPNDKIIV